MSTYNDIPSQLGNIMPCNDGGPMPGDYDYPQISSRRKSPSETELTKAKKTIGQLRKRVNELAAHNDLLSEAVIGFYNDKDYTLDPKVYDIVEAKQIEHRKVDLERLRQVFTEARNPEMLGKVMLADPNFSLVEQLGFDPDNF